MEDIQTEPYLRAREEWPTEGKHILANFDADSIVVYQAFNNKIADYAVEHNMFTGAPDYNPNRMSWIKTNYLWMMYRSDWARSKNQERILAIRLSRSFFEQILSNATSSSNTKEAKKQRAHESNEAKVRLQWDPDHHPSGTKHPSRRAIQLGLKGAFQLQNQSGIIKIYDITQFVKDNRFESEETLIVPQERVYRVSASIADIIQCDEI